VDEPSLAPSRLDRVGHPLPRCLVAAGDDHLGAVGGEPRSDGAADARGGAGDEGGLPVQSHG
jgi:hypothetical protein